MSVGVRHTVEVLRVLIVAALVEVGLRTATLPRVAGWCGIELDLESGGVAPRSGICLPRGAEAPVRAVVAVMAHWPFGDTCLRRCLVLGQRVRDLEPVLRMGVAVGEDGAFSAHSWLEIQGQSLDVESRSFRQFSADA